MNSIRAFLVLSGLCFCLATMLGCNSEPEMGQVKGVVTLNGEPIDMVSVSFNPDSFSGNSGASSSGITNDKGEYDLSYSMDPEIRGAITGPHCVVISDFAASESRGELPVRVPRKYRSSSDTPLKYEVKSGEQTFDIDLTD